jgi:ATP-binding cassette subfamily B protein
MQQRNIQSGPDLATYAKERRRSRRNEDTHTLRRIAQAFVPYKFQVILVFIAIILTTVLGLVNPVLVEYVFNNAIGKRNLTLLLIYVSIMIAVPVITGMIGVGQTYLNNLVGQRVMRDFRNNLYIHLQIMSLRFFTATRTGEIQSRLSNDVGGVQSVLTDTATSIVSNISTAVSTVIAMFIISPLLTVVSLGLLPIFIWITYKVGNVRRTTSNETQQSLANMTALMQETLSVSGILLTKTFGRQHYSENQFKQENQHLTDLEIRQQMIGRWFFMFISTFFSITPAVVYLVGGLQMIQDLHSSISLGAIVAFTTLQSRLFFPIGQLLNIQVEIQGALALFDRIFEYLDMPIDIQDAPDALSLQPEEIKGEIRFDNVSFTYHPDAEDKGATEDQKPLQPTIHNVSFTIKPGQLAALVGPSGAGKTTMTYLIPRLYDVDSGAVLIDDYNVKQIALTSLGEIIGVVTQETYLFHATIKENLLYARANATEEEMIAAARAAAIHNRIMELENGYDTIVGERGYKLSGGEKQRIAIARVILKDPRILILDEATSALDTHSERLIQAALEPLMKNRTTIAIAHRLSTILSADLILVVQHGAIVESGTHQELLERNGLYTQLYNEQFVRLDAASATA